LVRLVALVLFLCFSGAWNEEAPEMLPDANSLVEATISALACSSPNSWEIRHEAKTE
jgi:hypothetical protein